MAKLYIVQPLQARVQLSLALRRAVAEPRAGAEPLSVRGVIPKVRTLFAPPLALGTWQRVHLNQVTFLSTRMSVVSATGRSGSNKRKRD